MCTLTHSVVGENCPFASIVAVAKLLKLPVLFCLEKVGVPTGIFPLAFSDMPRS